MTLGKLNLNKNFFSLAATYIISSWGLIQFVDWLVKRYDFHTNWPDFIGLTALLLLPSALLFSWLQSEETHTFKKEKLFYGINLGVLLLALVPFLKSTLFTETTEKIMVTNEEGVKKEVEISKRAYIRQLAFLPFQNTAGQDWLAMAFPTIISADLKQCKRFNTLNPWHFKRDLKKMEYETKDPIPQSVQEKLMNSNFSDYVVSGKINKTKAGQFDYQLDLFSHKLSKIVFTKKGQSEDLYTLTDSLSFLINEHLFSNDLKIKPDTYKDIPTKEIYSANEKVVENYFTAYNAYYESNFDLVMKLINEALALDSKFAEGYNLRGIMQFSNGKIEEGKKDIEKAMQYSTSLSDFQQVKIKANYYKWVSNAYDKLIDFLTMCTKMYPEDKYAFEELIEYYEGGRNVDQAIEIGLQAEKLGHKNIFLFTMARLYAFKDDETKVNEYLKEYQKVFPDDTESRLKIGRIFFEKGNFEEAQQQFEEYKILNPNDLEANLQLAACNFQRGNFDEANALIKEALTRTKDYGDSIRVYNALGDHYAARGQIKKSIEIMKERWAFSSKYLPPLNQVSEKASTTCLYRHYIIGEIATYDAYLDDYLNALGAQRAFYEYGSWLNYYYVQEQGAGFEKYFSENEEAIQKNMPEGMFLGLKGYAKKFNGHYEEAIAILEEVVESSTDGGAEYHLSDCYRLTNQSEKAVKGFEKILAKRPYNGSILIKYAQSLNDNSQVAEAKIALEKLMRLWANSDPEYIEYQDALAFSKQINLAN